MLTTKDLLTQISDLAISLAAASTAPPTSEYDEGVAAGLAKASSLLDDLLINYADNGAPEAPETEDALQ